MTGHSVTMTGEIQRRYWMIGELAEQLGVATSMLRFWQSEFQFAVHRDAKGNRRFTAQEVEKVKEIHRLLKVEGYTIRGAKRQLLIDAKQKKTVKVLPSAAQQLISPV